MGNIVNPITSLTHPDVYSIPVVYVIGWRGRPGVHDEPQHKKQGEITLDLLDLLDIDYVIIEKDTSLDELKDVFENEFMSKLKSGSSVAVVVAKNAFDEYKISKTNGNVLTREMAIQCVCDYLSDDDMVISTTGKSSRELFEYREALNQGHGNDFLTVGSMGYSSSIALGVSLNTDKKVFCFDGDGAVLMHMGSLALAGSLKPQNFYHIMFNNSAHESVGGLATVMDDICIEEVVLACGYEKCFNASSLDELKDVLEEFVLSAGPVFLNVDVDISSRGDLGRPTTTPIENKDDFIRKLRG